MSISGNIRKMVTALNSPVEYQLPIENELIPMNERIGNEISMQYTGEIHCVSCGRKTNKSFNQGHCYPCFQSLASCDMCIMKPETCHYFAGTCRQPQWGEENCMQQHYVYLANSSGMKVGITRGSQIPTRWMDQGASQALPIFRVANRLLSGKVEVILKQHISDRTDWRKMLKGSPDEQDMIARKDELLALAEKELNDLQAQHEDSEIETLSKEETVTINYPVENYPEKVKSLNFDKTPHVTGILNGIKGQYLILDTGVINMRKFGGYHIELQ